jgi:5-formyltetrahydrofolate cyclo-ligase
MTIVLDHARAERKDDARDEADEARPMAEPTPDELVRTLAKRELRKRMRGLRRSTPAARLEERAALLRERLLAHPKITAARTIALFWPIEDRHELDLRPLDVALRGRGKRLAYPAIGEQPGLMEMRFVDDSSTLEEQGHGFAEPRADAPLVQPGELDVIVVPALALSLDGARLGYGAGYYDRALPRFCPPACSIGVCFAFQLLGELPTEAYDVPVDIVLTDEITLVPGEERPRERVGPSFERRAPGVVVVPRRPKA